MGCIWSHGSSEPSRSGTRQNFSSEQTFKATGEITAHVPYTRRQQSEVKPKALYGEYKCSKCGRFWTSRLSWANTYSRCSRCNRPVYPFNQRELRPSDFTKIPSDSQDHKRDLCQMCIKLGYYCGNFGKIKPNQGKNKI